MLDHMKLHPSQGEAEVMQMPKFWHPRMNWYGPAGIGTGRGIAGFRNWHQIPFLNAMPDRGRYNDEIAFHFFGDDPRRTAGRETLLVQILLTNKVYGNTHNSHMILLSTYRSATVLYPYVVTF